MKFIPTLLFIASLSGVASAATYTYSNNWNNTIASSFGANTPTTAYDNTAGATGTITVPTLDLSILAPGETLASVTITYTAPLVGQSDQIASQLSVVSGSQLFTSVTTQATTKLWSTEIDNLLKTSYLSHANLFKSASPFISTDEYLAENVTVASGSPIGATLTRNYSELRYTSGSAAEALLLANSGANPALTFSVRSEQFGAFTSDTPASDVNYNFAGSDTGTITVTYTTVPEPASALLGGIGFITLLRRRRR